MSSVTLDLGNSFLKAVDWAGQEPRTLRVGWDGDWRRSFEEWLDGGSASGTRVLVSSVVDPARRDEALGVAEARGLQPVLHPEPGLHIECRNPETIGKDRLYAARGAWERDAVPAIVVDAGTALTVDALGISDGRPAFLGGAIAPGPQLLARALSRGGAQLHEPTLQGDVPALGRETAEALRSGIVVGFQGAAKELVGRIAAEAGLDTNRLVVTGGARGFLLDAGLFEGWRCEEDEHLVHRGLLACAGAEGGA